MIKNLKRSACFGFLCALAACAAPEPAEEAVRSAPLASAAEIEALQSEPLLDWAADWNAPFAPFTIMDNLHYVGMAGVSSFLITTPDGHILLDGALPQSAPHILANIEALGFDVGDIKILLNSHAHFDHQGGLAALQRASGAVFVASAADQGVLEAGEVSYGPSMGIRSPRIRVDRIIGDGEIVSLGGVSLTAHLTPGHTPGCTSWTMALTGADGAAHNAFFHCSGSVAEQSLVPESYPGMVSDFRASFAKVREFEADVFLVNHGMLFGLEEKRARQIAGDADAFVDASALAAFNTRMEAAFEAELARQQAAAQ
jgi:metallo-beta-lactamase class B